MTVSSVSSAPNLTPKLISHKERIGILLVITGIYCLYHPLGIYTNTLPSWAPITVIDTLTPLVPSWIYPYAFVYFAAFVPAAVVNERPLFIRIAFCYFCVQLIAFSAFILVPVRMTLRPDFVEVDSFTTWGLNLCYFLDKPVNCCPSLHVALAFLGALTTRTVDRALGNIGLVVALLISLSTMLIKQHFLVDVILGLVLSVVSFQLIVAPYKPAQLTPHHRRKGRQRTLIMLISYSMVIGAFYISYAMGWNPTE